MDTVTKTRAAEIIGCSERYVDQLRDQRKLRWDYRGLRVRINAADVAAVRAERVAAGRLTA